MRSLSPLLFLALTAGAFAQQDESTSPSLHRVHISAHVPAGTGTVYIAGNLPELGPWKPDFRAMEGSGAMRQVVLTAPEGHELLFKLTTGGWHLEALNDDWSVPPNHRVLVTGDVDTSVSVAQFRSLDVEVPYPDPVRWETAIQRFEQDELTAPSPRGAVVFLGSSSFVLWHPRLAADMAPLTVVGRGFGGSTANDLLHYLDRTAVPLQPRAVVLYVGENDIAGGVFVQTAIGRYRQLIAALRSRIPGVRLYVVSSKPSPSREVYRERLDELNSLLKAECSGQPDLVYIDITPAMVDANGAPRAELFRDDMLHMKDAGYDGWTAIIRPMLLEAEGRFEAPR